MINKKLKKITKYNNLESEAINISKTLFSATNKSLTIEQNSHKTTVRRACSEFLSTPFLLSLMCNSTHLDENKRMSNTQQNLWRYRHSHPNKFQSTFYSGELRNYCVQCNPISKQHISTDNLSNDNKKSNYLLKKQKFLILTLKKNVIAMKF